MPRNPDTPCTRCGKLVWRSKTSLASPTCQPCRRDRLDMAVACKVCGETFMQPDRHGVYVRTTCSDVCAKAARAARKAAAARTAPTARKLHCTQCGTAVMTKSTRPDQTYCRGCLGLRTQARYRQKNHKRRLAMGQPLDVTSQYEATLRRKAKRCPLCLVRMTSKPQLPNSRELDHIIPINVGGTHTIGNVRIICRGCNLRRPKDGSDYVGPVTLWAQDQAVAESVCAARGQRLATRGTCGTCGAALRDYRCWTCRPSRRRTLTRAPGTDRLAAEMRDADHSWQAIADALGYGSPGSAYLGAQKWQRWQRSESIL